MKKLTILMLAVIAGSSLQAQVEIFATDSLIIDSVETGLGSGGSLGSFGGTNGAGNNTNDTGYKMVYWIHGLAGDESSWLRVIHATRDQGSYSLGNVYPERKAHSINKSYKHLIMSDLLNAGADYAEMLDDEANDPDFSTMKRSEAFAIAHSQGGLMARSVRRANYSNDPSIHSPSVFAGIATFGTPHLGATIIDNTNNGLTQKWINEGCEAIAKGEIQTFLNTKWWLNSLISAHDVSSFSNKACQGLNRIALPILVNAIRKPISNSYATKASDLKTLDSISSMDTIPVVAFYGEEKEPVLWRTLHTLTNTPDSVVTGASLLTDPFGLNDDQGLPDFVMNKISDYYLKRDSHKAKANGLYTLSGITKYSRIFWLGLILKSQADEEFRISRIYEKAGDWLLTANNRWKRLIGARKDSTYQSGYMCDCWEVSGPKGQYQYVRKRVFDPSNCGGPNSLNCAITPYIVHRIFEKPNDGVVVSESQKGYPGVYKTLLMRNTNHMQQRNCSETRIILNDLFDGKHGSQFSLAKK